MPNEIVIPGLPCRSIDDVLPFYEALGFEVAYRQERPHAFLSVQRGGIQLHFFDVPTFNPEDSMGTVVVLVPDTEALHGAFAAGLREAFGKVPTAGIPRMTRPRKRHGTTAGFSVVDPGGNWLRISRLGSTEGSEEERPTGGRLGQVVATAARQADSRGDEQGGIGVLVTGLARYADASAVERLPALVYLAELRLRVGEKEEGARLLKEVAALDLSLEEREAVAKDLATAEELASELGG